MKIYTEVIMEWDEDKQEMVEISSESYEHEGDIALCGGRAGGSHKYYIGESHGSGGIKDSPGLAAMTGGRGEKGKFVDYRHPKELPSDFHYMPEYVGAGGSYNPQGATGWAGSLPKMDPGGSDLPGDTRKRFPTRYPRAKALMSKARSYSGQFRDKWYDPYIDQAYVDPTKEAMYPGGASGAGNPQGAFITLEDALSQVQQDATQQIDTTGIQDALAGYKSPVWDSPIMHKEGMSGLHSAQLALDTAGKTYETGMGEIETLRDEAKAETEKAKYAEREKRRGILEGILPDAESKEANIARTGMAYSAPAEARAEIEAGGVEGDLADVQLSERDIEDKLKQKRLDFDVKEAGVKEDWETAKKQYGLDVAAALEGGTAALGDMLDTLQYLPQQHLQYGESLKGMQDMSNWIKGGYKWRKLDKGDIHKKTGTADSAAPPIGGWFGEGRQSFAGGVPAQGEEIVQAALNLANELSQQGGAPILELLPGVPTEERT